MWLNKQTNIENRRYKHRSRVRKLQRRRGMDAWVYHHFSASINASYSPRPVNKAAYKIYVRNHFPLNFDIGLKVRNV
jgi:ribosomal protein L25 (general stress protein Ctc)